MNQTALKQLGLGLALIFGGGILLCFINHNNEDTTQKNAQKTVVPADVARPTVQPLSPEAQTEQKLSEAQRKERENRALAQEQQLKQLQEQGKAPTPEPAPTNQPLVTEPVYHTVGESQPQDDLQVRTRPETVVANRVQQKRAEQQAPKATATPTRTQKSANYTIIDGDSLSKIAHQHGTSVSALAQANGIGVDDILNIGQQLVIPNKGSSVSAKKTTERKNERKDKQTAERKDKQATDKNKNKANRDEPIKTNGKPKAVKAHYSVQVSMADNQEKAEALARKYRQAGYKVQTSKTSRGVRVLVGAENSESGAKALKNKLDKDSRVNANGAWVKRVDTINN